MQRRSHVDRATQGRLDQTELCVFITQMWMQIKVSRISSSVPLWFRSQLVHMSVDGNAARAQEIAGPENIRATADKMHSASPGLKRTELARISGENMGDKGWWDSVCQQC